MNEILEKIKKYSLPPDKKLFKDSSAPIFKTKDVENLSERFEFELKRVGGNFIFCQSNEAITIALKSIIEKHNIHSCVISNSLDESILNNIKAEGKIKIRNIKELYNEVNPKMILSECGIGISHADYLIAETGSIVLKSKKEEGRMLSVLTPINIIIANATSILPDMLSFLEKINKNENEFREYSAYIFITGPSRTADIEKILIIGVHGPKELYVILKDF